MDPVNHCATRDTLSDGELAREGVEHHLKSITKLQGSQGWFASLLTEVVTGKTYTKPPPPDDKRPGSGSPLRACTRRRLYPLPTAHITRLPGMEL